MCPDGTFDGYAQLNHHVWKMEDGRFRLDDFELYRIARSFRKRVYRLIRMLPPEEKYALASQMRRAAVSVTNNIAEGHGRWHYQENIQYCRTSRGSTDELIDDFNVCEDENYGDQALVAGLKVEACYLVRRINGHIAYLRNSKQGDGS
jgi:four helix bundle protein